MLFLEPGLYFIAPFFGSFFNLFPEAVFWCLVRVSQVDRVYYFLIKAFFRRQRHQGIEGHCFERIDGCYGGIAVHILFFSLFCKDSLAVFYSFFVFYRVFYFRHFQGAVCPFVYIPKRHCLPTMFKFYPNIVPSLHSGVLGEICA